MRRETETCLDVSWNYLVFPGQTPDWSQQDQFVANMASLFENDKHIIVEKISAAFRHLLLVADNDKSGIFTFDKFFKFHFAFNLGHAVIEYNFQLDRNKCRRHVFVRSSTWILCGIVCRRKQGEL